MSKKLGFEKEERQIFGPFNDGRGNWIFADPLKIRRILTIELDGDPNKWFRETSQGDEKSRAVAVGRVATAALKAFSMAPFDPKTAQGADEAKCLSILDQFLQWQDAKKSSTKTCPTSQPSTVLVENSGTTALSVSSSISTDSDSDKSGA